MPLEVLVDPQQPLNAGATVLGSFASGSANGWTAEHGTVDASSGSLALRADGTGLSSFVLASGNAVDLDYAYNDYVEFKLAVPSGAHVAYLWYGCNGWNTGGFDDKRRVSIATATDGGQHTYRVFLGLQPWYNGALTMLKISPFDASPSGSVATLSDVRVGDGDPQVYELNEVEYKGSDAGVSHLESKHAAVWWGPDSSMPVGLGWKGAEQAKQTLRTIEQSWRVHSRVSRLLEPTYPKGAARTGMPKKVNLYVLWTKLPKHGSGGGYWSGLDSAGFPAMFIDPSGLRGSKYYDDWFQFMFLDENPDHIAQLGEGSLMKLLNSGIKPASESVYSLMARVLGINTADAFALMDRRLVGMDWSNGEAMRSAISRDTNGRWPGVYPVPVEAVPDRDNTWRPVRWAMPQQFAFSAVVLTPSSPTSTVSATVTGYAESSRRSDWKFSLVALNKNSQWSARYSSLTGNGQTASITLAPSDTHVFLVVTATPGETLDPTLGPENMKNPEGLTYPFEFTVSGASPAGVRSNLWSEELVAAPDYVVHSNGGGRKSPAATVDASAYIGPDALVMGSAKVLGNARVLGHAVVAESATVSGDAVITGSAVVRGAATVTDRARVGGWAIVKETAIISGDAKVRGSATVWGNTLAHFTAIIQGQSRVWREGNASVAGEAILDGDYVGCRAVSNGVQYGWMWGGVTEETLAKRTAPAGYLLDWKFDTKMDTTVQDTLGFYHGYLRGSPVWNNGSGHSGVYDLDGVDDYVVVADRSIAFEQKMTAAFVLRMADSPQSVQSVFSMGAGKSEYLALSVSSVDGSVALELAHAGRRYRVARRHCMCVGVWTHLAFTVGSDSMALFINGARVGSTAVPGVTPLSLFSETEDYTLPEFVYFGKNGGAPSQALLHATVDRVSLWRIVLTDDVIRSAGADYAPLCAAVGSSEKSHTSARAVLAVLLCACALCEALVDPEVAMDPTQGLNQGSTSLGSFSRNHTAQGWTADGGALEASGGSLVLTATGGASASFVLSSTPAVDLDRAYNDWVEFKLKVPAGARTAYLWYGCNGWHTGGFDTKRRVAFTTAADGAEHTYRFFLGLQPWYNGALSMLKVTPFGDATTTAGAVATLNDVAVGDAEDLQYLLNEIEYSATDTSVSHYETKHLAVWWGPDSTTPAGYGWQGLAQARLTLRNAEQAWKVYTHVRKMRIPSYVMKGDRGGSRRKVNLYVFLTGLPKHSGKGGYFSGIDSGGYPAMYIDASGLRGDPPSDVVSHELFHVFQFDQDSTLYGPWWEALANYGREMWVNVFWPLTGNTEPSAPVSLAGPNFLYWPQFTDGHGAKYYDDRYHLVYLDQNPDNLPNLGDGSVTKLLNAGEPVSGETSFQRIARVMKVDLDVLYPAVHKHLVGMDWDNAPALRAALAGETSGRWPGVLPVPVEAVPDRDNTWRPVRWAMPQQFAFSPIVLTPETATSTVTVKVTGYAESSRQSGWRVTLVALNKNNAWSSRYGATVKDQETASITLTSSDTHLFLVVSAIPGVTLEPVQGAEAIRSPACLFYPFEFTVSGASPIGIRSSLWSQEYDLTGLVTHANGGGRKSTTATVAETAYIGPDALVLESAHVLDHARITGHAIVAGTATVSDWGVVTGSAVVKDRALVAERARVSGWAVLKDSVVVSGRARIRGSAVVYGWSTNINYNALVQGRSLVWYTSGAGTVAGDAILDGDYNGGKGVKNGIQYGWMWDGVDAETIAKRTAPAGYMLDWTLDNYYESSVQDTLGFYTGYQRGSPAWSASVQNHSGVLAFDGVDDYVVASDRSVAFEQQMTWAFVLRLATPAAAQCVFSMGSNASQHLSLSTTTTGAVVLKLALGGRAYTVATSGAVGSGWAHLAFTVGGSMMALFHNGARVGSANVSGATPAALFSDVEDYALREFVYVGKNGGDASQALLHGSVDRVSAWRRVLTDAELSSAACTAVDCRAASGSSGKTASSGAGSSTHSSRSHKSSSASHETSAHGSSSGHHQRSGAGRTGLAVASVAPEVSVDPRQQLNSGYTSLGSQGWTAEHGSVNAGSLTADGSGTASFDYVEFKLKVPSGAHTAYLWYGCDGWNTGGFDDKRRVSFTTATDGGQHTYRVFLGLQPWYNGALTMLKISPFGDASSRGAVATLSDAKVGDGDSQVYELNEAEYSGSDTSISHLESKHVSVWWGPDSSRPAGFGFKGRDQARLVLRTMESSWKVYKRLLKLNEPTYTNANPSRSGAPKKVNLYVLLTSLPKHNANEGGYFAGTDSQGFPAMFVDASGLRGNPPTEVIPHELYHCFQMGQKSDLPGQWWEAMANYGRERWIQVFWPQCGDPEPSETLSRSAPTFLYYTPFTDGHGGKYYDDWFQFLYLDENPEKLPQLGDGAVTKILNGGTKRDGESAYGVIARVLQIDLPQVYSGLHKHLVGMDWANGVAMRSNFAGETNGRWPGVMPVPVEAVPDRSNAWRPVRWAMPQQFAFAPIVLTPSSATAKVSVTLTGYAESEHQSDWRFTLVALNKNNGWSSRYSATAKNLQTASITLTSSDTHLFLVVSATPGVPLDPTQGPDAIRNPDCRTHPFEFTVSGASPAGIRSGLWAADYAADNYVTHSNGGGKKSRDAVVDASAYVGPNAIVAGSARVQGNARILGHAIVADSATVSGNAVVSGGAVVRGSATVSGNAVVSGGAVVRGSATVTNNARVSGWAVLKESAAVSGSARVRGSAVLYERASVEGNAIVQGMAHLWHTSGTVSGEAILDGDFMSGNGVSNGVQYGWMWGGLDDATMAKRTAPAGYMLEWTFASKMDSTALDTLGFYNGYLRGSPAWSDGDGDHAGVYTFDGKDDYAVVADRSVAFEQRMTVALVLRMEASTTRSLFSMGSSASEHLALSSSTYAGAAVLELAHAGKTYRVAAAHGLCAGKWAHVAFTIGDGKMALYVNGRSAGSTPVGSATPMSLFDDGEDYALPGFVYVGKNGAATAKLLRGAVDKVSVWRRVLSDGEIQQAGSSFDSSCSEGALPGPDSDSAVAPATSSSRKDDKPDDKSDKPESNVPASSSHTPSHTTPTVSSDDDLLSAGGCAAVGAGLLVAIAAALY
eukprot:m51a1_g6991 hypothetical protein (3074) ;mRNA; r:159123-171178